jgi:hypothetical protein
MKDTWGTSGGAKETDKEWIARGGHLTTKDSWNAIDFGVKANIHGWMDKHKAHIPEYDFWTSFFAITVDDALGTDPASKKNCVVCHQESEDGCFRNGSHWRSPINVCTWKKHTVQQCAINYINGPMAAEDCAMLGIEVSYLRKLLAQTKKRPTIVRNMKNFSHPSIT